jgi:hypothetical protein
MKPFLVALALALSPGLAAQNPPSVTASGGGSRSAGNAVLPPLPFTFVGQLRQNGRVEVLVMRGQELHTLATGDSIDGEYRVEDITDSTISFTYLPLKLKQTWAFRR